MLVGRTALLEAVEIQLAAGGSVVLAGPSGIGKTAVLDAVAHAASSRGERVLRVGTGEMERWIPYAGLADLLTQVPRRYLDELPGPQRAAIDAVLMRGQSGPGVGSQVQLARRLAWQTVLRRYAADGPPILIVVDDAQWLDAASADVIGYAARRLSNLPVRAAAAQRWPERGESRASARAMALCPPPVRQLTVPQLDADDLADLLELHGLPCRAASRLHADSGGNPYLALALSGAFADRVGLASWQPAPLPDGVRQLLRDRILALQEPVRRTLLVAALANRPTVALLNRAGRPDAQRDIRLAASAGLVTEDGSVVRFTPAWVAAVLSEDTTAEDRARIHTVLSTVAADAVDRARHQAMSSVDQGPEVARSLVAAAQEARRRGARGLAAELYLLAADRTPLELSAERLDWLIAAAEAAAASSRADLAGRAAEAVLAADAPAAYRVRARVALIDLAGQALLDMDEMLAAALADAGSDPQLLALVRLRLCWQAMVEGRPRRAVTEGRRAGLLAQQAGDTRTEAMALSAQAQVERVLGRPSYAETLERAMALPEPPMHGFLHNTPRYLAARFAFFDDRLDEARAELLRMLAAVEGAGGEQLIDILRSLAEVSARAGRCREALDFSGRAIRVSEETGLSPGPAWYTASVAELAGGGLPRAAAYAERGVRASEQERDSIYLCRNLYASGLARLRLGDARGGIEALRRVRDLEASQGLSDPSMLRWHSDLAAALATAGEYEEAEATLAAAREASARLARAPGALARLDRSEAILWGERGRADEGAAVLAQVARRFGALGQPIEHGHTLLVLGQIERRRRRYAAARGVVREALAIFNAVAAKPWAEQAAQALARVDGAVADPAPAPPEARIPFNGSAHHPVQVPAAVSLTATEARIAGLVREGASNREIAAKLFVSVKTVEATLTRIYRKMGVRSRTQLSSRLATTQ